MSWLPPPPAPSPSTGRPWRPEGVTAPDAVLAALAYVVVEELLEDRVALTVTRWPTLDERGRLVFSGAARPVVVRREALEAVLRERRRLGRREGLTPAQVEAAENRPVAVGDVLAAGSDPRRPPRRPEALLAPPVIDVTPQAREEAQVALSAAVTPVVGR